MIVDHILDADAFALWAQNDAQPYREGLAEPQDWRAWGRRALASYNRQHTGGAAITAEDFAEGIRRARVQFETIRKECREMAKHRASNPGAK